MDEQQKYIKENSCHVKYNPIVIRLCLSLASKSASAYDVINFNEKTGKGFLVLPIHKRFCQVTELWILHSPLKSFNKNNIKELIQKSNELHENGTFFVLLMEKMKIQEESLNLLWSNHNDELIVNVDLGNIDVNHASL